MKVFSKKIFHFFSYLFLNLIENETISNTKKMMLSKGLREKKNKVDFSLISQYFLSFQASVYHENK